MAKKIKIFAWIAAALLLLWLGPRWLDQGLDGRLAVRVITAEAADQRLWAMIGVGEVIRNRGAIRGFSVLKKDLEGFYRSQLAGTRRKAHAAWVLSRVTNLTQHSTHFENVRQFGPPPWEGQMRKTVHLDDLQFYKRRK